MKIILLARGKTIPISNLTQINHCFQMILYGLYLNFIKLGHEVIQINQELYTRKSNPNYSTFPNTDIIIHIACSENFTEETYKQLKSKCKKYVSFSEGAPLWCDFNFVIGTKKSFKKGIGIIAPYTPEFYQNIEKEPKTILLDHAYIKFWTANQKRDWARKIWSWLEPLKEKYKIYTLVKGGTDQYGDWKQKTLELLPNFIIPLISNTSDTRQTFDFKTYLELTNKFETFIVVNHGSYNYSVLDMLVRGIHVLTPPDFIPRSNINLFQIPIFTSQEELLKEINRPINQNILNEKIKLCTPMNEVVTIMANYFNKWIN